MVPCACASFQMMLIEELEPAAAGSTQAVSLCRRCGPGQRGTLVENCHPEPSHASPTKGHAVAIRGGAAMGAHSSCGCYVTNSPPRPMMTQSHQAITQPTMQSVCFESCSMHACMQVHAVISSWGCGPGQRVGNLC